MNEKKEPSALINENIRFDKLQVISNDGTNLGVIARRVALDAAKVQGLDLVLVSDQGSMGVPVAKIMDYGKVIYAKKKQLTEAKKHQKVIQIKEIKLRPKIGEHDLQTKLTQAIDFLSEGKHVKVTIMFKGREAVGIQEKATDLFNKINQAFADAGLNKVAVEKDLKSFQSWSRIYTAKK